MADKKSKSMTEKLADSHHQLSKEKMKIRNAGNVGSGNTVGIFQLSCAEELKIGVWVI